MTFFIGRGTQPDVTPPTTATPTGTDVLMSRYLQKGVEEGLVLGELPRQVLQLRPAGDGQAAELITVRRIVERRMATEFYRLDHDEYGQARQVPIELASLRSESSF